jgi:WD40 repeat protein
MYKYTLADLLDSRDDLTRQTSTGQYRVVHEFVDQNAQQAQNKHVTTFNCVNSFPSPLLLVAWSNRTLSVFDCVTQQEVRRLESKELHAKPVHTVQLNEGSHYSNTTLSSHEVFLTAATDNVMKLWDIRQKACVRKLEGHQNRAQRVGVAFSPCMRYIACGSEDKRLYYYDIGQGKHVQSVKGHIDIVSSVDFHPLHARVATASFDGRVRVFVP